jgi:hypothetical protein
MKNKTYKDFTQNPKFACPYAIRDLIKGLDSKDIRKLLMLLMHHLQPIWKGLKGIRFLPLAPKSKFQFEKYCKESFQPLSYNIINLIIMLLNLRH